MAPHVAVLVRPVEGGHQAFCRTRDCTEGPDGGPWWSELHVVKAGAEDDARSHRQWHRRQQPVPTEPEAWPPWATVTEIGEGRWQIDLDGTLNGTRIKGHATAGSLASLRQLVAAIEEFEATQSVAALIARAGLALDAEIPAALPGLSRFVVRPLKEASIERVGDLAARTDGQLRDVAQFGERRLAALKTALTELAS